MSSHAIMRPRIKRAVQAAALLAGAILIVIPQPVSALDPVTSTLHPWYNPDFKANRCVPGTGSPQLVGSENAEKIWNYFLAKRVHPVLIAGIMGNMQAESGFRPDIVQGGSTSNTPRPGVGFGLSQWTPAGRQKLLIDRAKAAGKQPSDLGVQLDYIWWELTDQASFYKKRAGDPLFAVDPNSSSALRDATNVYLLKYEAPKVPNLSERLSAAKRILAKYGGNTPTGGGSVISESEDACAPDGSNGSLIGGMSLPTDQKWYDHNPRFFTKPHHDYPAADIPVPVGTPIYAVTAGTVIQAPTSSARSGYGLGVKIDAGNGIIMIYGHGTDGGSIQGAKKGDVVKPGQLIMHSGNTGRSTGPHLHLEIRVNGTKVCPQNLLDALGKGQTPPDIKSLPRSGCSY
ncbi:hypothetical protein CR970_01065 [Candidatus Saccharibacteria bacterium]|nr:MAG: hypothetical protein CR970_01065 [Candidatus Saccharibacteria bacterium]